MLAGHIVQGPPAGPEKPAMQRQTSLPAGAELLPGHATHTVADDAPITDEEVLAEHGVQERVLAFT